MKNILFEDNLLLVPALCSANHRSSLFNDAVSSAEARVSNGRIGVSNKSVVTCVMVLPQHSPGDQPASSLRMEPEPSQI